MNPMKFSPLRRRQRTQNRMIEHFAISKASLARGDNLVHCGNLQPYLRSYLLNRETTRDSVLGRLPPRRHMAKSQDHAHSRALSYRGSTHRRLTRLEHSFKSLYGSGVGQVQMFQYLGGAPFLLGDATLTAPPACPRLPSPERSSIFRAENPYC